MNLKRNNPKEKSLRSNSQVRDKLTYFIASMEDNKAKCIVDIAKNLLIYAEQTDNLFKTGNTVRINGFSKLFHGGLFSNADAIDSPSISFHLDLNGNPDYISLGAVADASSKHDLLMSPGIIGVTISLNGSTQVHRSTMIKLDMTDSEILAKVELELRRANAQAYLTR